MAEAPKGIHLKTTLEEQAKVYLDGLEQVVYDTAADNTLKFRLFDSINDLRVLLFIAIHDGSFSQ